MYTLKNDKAENIYAEKGGIFVAERRHGVSSPHMSL